MGMPYSSGLVSACTQAHIITFFESTNYEINVISRCKLTPARATPKDQFCSRRDWRMELCTPRDAKHVLSVNSAQLKHLQERQSQVDSSAHHETLKDDGVDFTQGKVTKFRLVHPEGNPGSRD